MIGRNAFMIAWLISMTASLATSQFACSQTAASSDTAPLVVSGVVVDVYQSASNEQQYVVQLLVRESSARWNATSTPPVDFPGPGDCLYAHVQITNRSTAPFLPRPNMVIEASLKPDSRPQWMAVGPNWFREAGAATGTTVASSRQDDLGIRVESVSLRLRRALKVTEVVPNSPGAKAGLEVGDVLVEADGVALNRPEQWTEAVRRGNGQMKILVRDVRSGRDVPVDVNGNRDAMAASGAGRSLGVKTELAFFRGKPALKVTSVENGSPAAQSGISSGMLILSAGDIPAASPEKLDQVVSQAGNTVDLEVVADPASGQSRNVRVRLR